MRLQQYSPMANICLYFHLPLHKKLQSFGIFDLGRDTAYFDEARLHKELQLIEDQGFSILSDCIQDLSAQAEGEAVCALAFSGAFWEGIEHAPTSNWEKIKRQLTGQKADLLAKPYYNSLNFLIDRDLLEQEVAIQQLKLQALQGKKSHTFLHTDLLYNDFLAYWAKKQQFKLVFAPWQEEALQGRNRYQLFHAPHYPELGILLPDLKLAEYLESHDLTTSEVYDQLAEKCQDHNLLTLGFDLYELSGSPHRFRNLVAALLKLQKEGKARVLSPETVANWDRNGGQLSIADFDSIHEKKDTDPWLENHLQRDAWLALYSQKKIIWESPFLQDAYYFFQMGKKYDGDQEFLQAYRHFRSVLADKNLKSSTKSV